MNEVSDEMSDFLHTIRESFSPGLRMAFAYGSGVFKQRGHKSIKDNMIDFIFVVDDSVAWHERNISRHPNHYSFLRHLGADRVTAIQNSYGARIYFNTLVRFNERMIKYGVIDAHHFQRDMRMWETLYVAGRLHKPVVTFVGMDHPDIAELNVTNLRSAVQTSLLLLPEKFTYEELFLCVTGLSYSGDVRMVIGEDKGKIKNIVTPNIHKFKNLYSSIIAENENLHCLSDSIEQNLDLEVQATYINNLPQILRYRVLQTLSVYTDPSAVVSTLTTRVSDRADYEAAVLGAFHGIVRKSSTSQTIKGVATAGVSKSVVYAAQKLTKMVKSLR